MATNHRAERLAPQFIKYLEVANLPASPIDPNNVDQWGVLLNAYEI